MIKLSVVKKPKFYLVNYNSEITDTQIPDFDDVMSQLKRYAIKPEIFKAEPALTGLSEEEKKKILEFRGRVLEGKLEKINYSPSC